MFDRPFPILNVIFSSFSTEPPDYPNLKIAELREGGVVLAQRGTLAPFLEKGLTLFQAVWHPQSVIKPAPRVYRRGIFSVRFKQNGWWPRNAAALFLSELQHTAEIRGVFLDRWKKLENHLLWLLY